MSSQDILTLPPPPPDAKLPYATGPFQFGELRVPAGKGPHPVAMVVHGGFWKAQYSVAHSGHMCAALTKAGIATWSIEYRRVGNPGGGWPGTFEDVTSGFRFLPQIAPKYNLDLKTVTAVGHSAGGQLVLCLAAHQLKLRRVVSLAGVVDLRMAWALQLGGGAVEAFLGGPPEGVPDHYKEASPAEIKFPPGVKQRLIHGVLDDIIPPAMSRGYRDAKHRQKEDVALLEIPAAGHFELIDPRSQAWPQVENTVMKLQS